MNRRTLVLAHKNQQSDASANNGRGTAPRTLASPAETVHFARMETIKFKYARSYIKPFLIIRLSVV